MEGLFFLSPLISRILHHSAPKMVKSEWHAPQNHNERELRGEVNDKHIEESWEVVRSTGLAGLMWLLAGRRGYTEVGRSPSEGEVKVCRGVHTLVSCHLSSKSVVKAGAICSV